MGLSCGASVIKYGIFIFNLICAVGGIALITVGAIPLFKINSIRETFSDSNPALVPISVLVLGSIIFIISFFGCCGAIQENQCMVTTYAIFLFVLVILQVVIAVLAFIYTPKLADASVKGLEKIFIENTEHSRKVVDEIQRGLECCGTKGPTSWAPNPIPASCCTQTTCTVDNSFQSGCSKILNDLVRGSGNLIAWIAIVFGAFELIGVIFACCLANSIRNSNRRQYA